MLGPSASGQSLFASPDTGTALGIASLLFLDEDLSEDFSSGTHGFRSSRACEPWFNIGGLKP